MTWTWTDTPPTTPGWYWWRSWHHALRSGVVLVEDGLTCLGNTVYNLGGQWSDKPVPEPKEG